MDRAFDTRDAGLNVLLGDPVFESLTSDARYHALVERLGLSQYFQAMIQKLAGNGLTDTKVKIAAWLKNYNESRPHRALNNLAPLGKWSPSFRRL